jgi:hypothetical protein
MRPNFRIKFVLTTTWYKRCTGARVSTIPAAKSGVPRSSHVVKNISTYLVHHCRLARHASLLLARHQKRAHQPWQGLCGERHVPQSACHHRVPSTYTLENAVGSGTPERPRSSGERVRFFPSSKDAVFSGRKSQLATAGTLAGEPQSRLLKLFEHCGNNDPQRKDRNVPVVQNVSSTFLSFGWASARRGWWWERKVGCVTP